jgi:hypothetical protein
MAASSSAGRRVRRPAAGGSEPATILVRETAVRSRSESDVHAAKVGGASR